MGIEEFREGVPHAYLILLGSLFYQASSMEFVVFGLTTEHTEELPILLTEVMEPFPMSLTFPFFHFWLDLSRINSLDFLHQTFQQPVVSKCGPLHRILAEGTLERTVWCFPNLRDACEAEIVPAVNGDRLLQNVLADGTDQFFLQCAGEQLAGHD
jgi:hypothetical protein